MIWRFLARISAYSLAYRRFKRRVLVDDIFAAACFKPVQLRPKCSSRHGEVLGPAAESVPFR